MGFCVFSLGVPVCVSVTPYAKNLFIMRKSARQNAPYAKLGQSPLFGWTRKDLSCGLGVCGMGNEGKGGVYSNFLYSFLNLEILRDKKKL